MTDEKGSPFIEDFKFVEDVPEIDTEKLLHLIEKHDGSFDDEGNVKDSKVYWGSQQQIRASLGVPSVDEVNAAIKALLKRIEELEGARKK